MSRDSNIYSCRKIKICNPDRLLQIKVHDFVFSSVFQYFSGIFQVACKKMLICNLDRLLPRQKDNAAALQYQTCTPFEILLQSSSAENWRTGGLMSAQQCVIQRSGWSSKLSFMRWEQRAHRLEVELRKNRQSSSKTQYCQLPTLFLFAFFVAKCGCKYPVCTANRLE